MGVGCVGGGVRGKLGRHLKREKTFVTPSIKKKALGYPKPKNVKNRSQLQKKKNNFRGGRQRGWKTCFSILFGG